jgi:hypothetical protein
MSMSEAKHAPGPWCFEPFVDAIHVLDAHGEKVCTLSDRDTHKQGLPPANARLIAAAPELLEIATRIANGGMSYPTPLRKQAEAVVAKIAGN